MVRDKNQGSTRIIDVYPNVGGGITISALEPGSPLQDAHEHFVSIPLEDVDALLARIAEVKSQCEGGQQS